MPPLAQLPAPSPEPVLTPEDLAKRCHEERETVIRWMTTGPPHKRLGHFRKGRKLLTTESLFAQFWAANLETPPPCTPSTSPFERKVLERAYWMVGELVKLRRVRVEPAPGEEPKDAA